MATLEKIIFKAYKDGDFQKEAGSTYKAMLNPENISLNREIQYASQPKPGSSEASPEYNNAQGSTLSFDLVIDCTGVVDSKDVDLPKNLSKLKKVVYDFNGSIHRSNFVKIIWGEGLEFKGVLTSMNVSYNLFAPSGKPLRAKVSLKFTSYVSPSQASKEEDKNSPDMTHIIEVIEGDSLPHLAYDTYNDTSLFVSLARFNDLNRFRHIKAGTELVFPPLIQEGG